MYSVIDIETTGNHAQQHSITEVAIINFDGEKITEEYCTFVRPEEAIPNFITQFTGISNQMVEQAPEWAEVMDKIETMTAGNILVAHNAHFDYSFLKSAFMQCGRSFNRKTLCTLRLSKKLFPGLPSYALNKLCSALGLQTKAMHRAGADAMAALELLQWLQSHDANSIIPAMLKQRANEFTLPPHLLKETIQALPQEAGVYYFLDKKENVLYVGKAKNLRARIIQHFTSSSSTRMRTQLMNRIHDVRFERCGNELVAMLFESAEIKRWFPPFNVIQKISDNNYGVYCYEDGKGYLRFGIKKLSRHDQPLLSFSSLPEARNFISERVTDFHLCPKLCGLQRSHGACYDFEEGKCDGACAGAVAVRMYNARVKKSLKVMKTDALTCAITGKGRVKGEHSIVLMECGKYLGFGFLQRRMPSGITRRSFNKWKEQITPQRDNHEVQMIIRSYLQTHNNYKLLLL